MAFQSKGFSWGNMCVLFSCVSTAACFLKVTSDGNDLTAFPQLPIDVYVLSLMNNMIPDIPAGRLANQPYLSELLMNDNLLTEFPDMCDVKATLKIAKFKGNTIATIDTGRLCCLTGIKELHLEGNQLTNFPDLSCLASTLNTLDLSNNPFVQYVHSRLATMVELKVLKLDKLELTDDEITMLTAPPNVQELYITWNALTDFPNWGPLPSVVTIDMEHNSMEYVSEISIQNYRNLEDLKVSYNPVTKYPSNESLSFPKLTDFRASDTSSMSLLTCDFLEKMRELQTFIAPRNGFLTWTCDLSEPHYNLIDVKLFSSTITHLPDDLSMFPALKVLNLGNNPIVVFPDFGRDLGKTLASLMISGNGNIPDHALSGQFPVLTYLRIDDTMALTRFPLLGHMPSLESFTLRATSLSLIPCMTFPLLPKLDLLILNDNSLQTFPNISSKLPKLTTSKLFNNAFVCDCGMKWLQENLNLAGDTAICNGSPNLKSKPFEDIDFNALDCNTASEFQGFLPKSPYLEEVAKFYNRMFQELDVRNNIECAALCQQNVNCQGWKTLKMMQGKKRCQMYSNTCIASDTPPKTELGIHTNVFKNL